MKGQITKHEWEPDIFPGKYCPLCGTVMTILLSGGTIYRQVGKPHMVEEPLCITRKIQSDESTHNNIL